jgi:hypothetical protein
MSVLFIVRLILIAGNVWETPHLDSKIVPRMRYGHSAVLFGVSNCVVRVQTDWQNCQERNGMGVPTMINIHLPIEWMTKHRMTKMMVEITRLS